MNKTVLFAIALGLCVGAVGGPSVATAKLIVPETPQIYEHVIVTTTDGWEYYNVSVELLSESKAVRVIRPDGASKNFPLSQVKSIQDQVGRDITRHVIPGWQGTPQGAPPPTSPPAAAQPTQPADYDEVARDVKYDAPLAHEKRLDYRFRTAISAGAGYGWAQGDWFAPFDEGASYHLQGRIALSNTVYLNLGYRHQELEYGPEYEDRGGEIPYMREYFIGLGFMPRRSHVMQAIPYLELNVGRIEHSWTPYMSHPHPGDPEDDVTVVVTGDKIRTGLLGQVGLMLPMSKSLGLDFGATVTYTGQEPFDLRDVDYKGVVFGAQAALVLFIGD